jgi:hypothetical protein
MNEVGGCLFHDVKEIISHRLARHVSLLCSTALKSRCLETTFITEIGSTEISTTFMG